LNGLNVLNDLNDLNDLNKPLNKEEFMPEPLVLEIFSDFV